MNSVHLPLQSGSDAILSRMRRGHNSAQYRKIVENLRSKIPDIAITTDIIIGFPGETESDFQETYNLIEELRFQSAFIFNYSIRPGTSAAEYPDQIPNEIKQERFLRLLELQEAITLQNNESEIGTKLEILIFNNGRKDSQTGNYSGRDYKNQLVHISETSEKLSPGEYRTVEIVQAAPHHLLGKLLKK